ncbi:MAG: amidohydrolase [Aureliella sp.]
MKHYHSPKTWIAWVALSCLCVFSTQQSRAAGPLAIQGATIITVSGETLENASVLIRDGRIEAVGVDIKIPGEAFVIDGTGKVVMPGIVDTHNAAGMSQANEQASVVPFLSVVDSIDPIASYFEECRRNGITCASVVPGNSTLIGGKAAIVKTAGGYVNDMLVRRDSALKLSLRPTSGSRMSQMAQLRKELDAAKKALAKEEEDEDNDKEEKKPEDSKDAGKKPEADAKKAEDTKSDEAQSDAAKTEKAKDEGLEALKLAVKGEMPVYIYCEVAMDVAAAIQLAEDYQLDPIYVLGRECYPAAKLLAKQKKTVILDPTLVFWKTNPRTREDEKIELPKIYHDAEVPFIFQVNDSGRRSTLGDSYFWYQAATAVKYGVSEADAIAALTLEPAKLLGLDDRIGSIEAGKEADLVVLTGHPLDISTWVETTIVDGEVVYKREDDEKLKRLLSPEVE